MHTAHNRPLVIVGSGLAGTTTLVHELLKIAADPLITESSPISIQLIERYPEQLHGGIAYGKMPEFGNHRLNLSSSKVPILAADQLPKGFPTFPEYIQGLAKQALADPKQGKSVHDAYLAALQDPPREVFGDYLAHLVDLAAEKAGKKVQLTKTIGEAIALDVSGSHPTLTIREGEHTHAIEAMHVVLSTGFKETLRAPFLEKILESPLYLDDNYSKRGNEFYHSILNEQKTSDHPQDHRTLIIGTGLSANDAALRLLQSGYQGKITMLSRNGLEHAGYKAVASAEEYLKTGLPGEMRPDRVEELEKRVPRFMDVVNAAKGHAIDTTGVTEKNILISMRREFNVLVQRKGFTAEEVLGYWERFIPKVASVLEPSACKRLYDQHASWLTTHRIGTTPENTKIMHDAQQSGQLEIVAGYISTKENEKPYEKDNKIHITYTPVPRVGRAEHANSLTPRNWVSEDNNARDVKTETLTVDRVVSGMGYRLHFHNGKDAIRENMPPLWDSLAKTGSLDWHKQSGEGLAVDSDFTMLNRQGKRVEGVTVVGVPASGATMFMDLPYIEKPGKSGGRFPPFQANVVGTVTAVRVMVDKMHERIRGSALAHDDVLGSEVDAGTAVAHHHRPEPLAHIAR